MGDHRSGEVIADNPEVAFTDGTYFYITVFNGQLPGAPVPLLAKYPLTIATKVCRRRRVQLSSVPA
jgi:hypothetical protein